MRLALGMPCIRAASSDSRVSAEAAALQNVCIPPGEHLMMFGDSVTRYQWLLLAYAVRHGIEYNRSLRVGSTTSAQRTEAHGTLNELLHYEPTWRNWTQFFEGSNDMLGPDAACDCYRDDSCCKWWQRQKGACTTVCAIPGEPVPYWEHRYFRARNVSLSFMTLNGRQDLRGRWLPGDGQDISSAVIMRPPYRPTWKMNLSSFLVDIVPQYRPRMTIDH